MKKTLKKIVALAVSAAIMISGIPGTVFKNYEKTMVASAAPSAASFLDSGYAKDDVTVYNGSGESFKVGGRTYYQGLVFDGYSEISFDVSDVSEVEFTVGHVDDTRSSDGKMIIYLDGNEWDTQSLTVNMDYMDYPVNTKNASTLKIKIEGSYGSEYALADVMINGNSEGTNYSCPYYESAKDFLKKGFNIDDDTTLIYEESSIGEYETYALNGRTYYQGILFNGYAEISFNVDNVDELSFTIGHVDTSSMKDGTIFFYRDNVLYDKIDLTWDMLWTDYSIDVSKNSVFRVVTEWSYGSQYALAEINVDSCEEEISYTTPQYSNAVDFMNSIYYCDEYTLYTEKEDKKEMDSFNMSGRTYFQGVVFNGYGEGTFNVENVKKMSFTLGHVDDSSLKTGKMTIYKDGILDKTIELEWNNNLEKIELDLSNTSVLRFEFEQPYGSKYALANLKIDKKGPKTQYVVPDYDSVLDMYEKQFWDKENRIYRINPETKLNEEFSVNSKTYTEGIVFEGYAHAGFNVERIKSLNLYIGHVDGTRNYNGKMDIYLDDELKDTLELTYDMPLKNINIDLKDAKTLYISFEYSYGSEYAFVNATFEKMEPVIDDEPEEDGYSVDLNVEKNASGINVENLEDGGTYTGNVSFNVESDIACVVLISEEGEEDYSKLDGVAKGINTYMYIVNISVNIVVNVYILGDLNFDGKVSSTDAKQLQRADAEMIYLSELQLNVLDVNGDGSVNTTDAKQIQRYEAGLTQFKW